MPVVFALGRFASDLFVVIISVIFLTIIILDKKYNYLINKISIPFFLWCFLLIIISLFSNDPILSLESSLFYFRFGLFGLAVIYVLNNYSNWHLLSLKFFILSYLLTLFIVSIEILFNFNLVIYLMTGYGQYVQSLVYPNNRITGNFGEDVMLGSFIARTMPIFLAIFLVRLNFFSSLKIFFIFLLIFITIIIAFLSHERASIFYILMSVTILLLCLNVKNKYLYLIISSPIILLSFTLYLNKTFFERFIVHTYNQISSAKFLSFSDHYLNYYQTAFQIFLENSFFGIGPKMYRLECLKYVTNVDPCNTHPHNIYLQLLSEVGLIASTPVILLLIVFIYIILRHIFSKLFLKKEFLNNYQICLSIACFVFLFPFIPTGSFFNNYLNCIFFFSSAMLLQSFKFIKS